MLTQVWGAVTREDFEGYSKEVLDHIVSGKVKARIHKIYPLAEVTKAQNDIESRKTTGKLVLKI